MFKKILIAEDIDTISIGVASILEKHTNADVRNTKYCDEAIAKIKRAIAEESPFDLIITDLSFKEDHRETTIANGEGLIAAIRKIQPNVKIIVYSIDDRAHRIKALFNNFSINAFIAKGRDSIAEFPYALQMISATDAFYISQQVAHLFEEKSISEIDRYDIELLKHLSQGLTQSEISEIIKAQGKNTSSTSSIEKRINKLKIYFKANNTIHLIAIAKDMGVI